MKFRTKPYVKGRQKTCGEQSSMSNSIYFLFQDFQSEEVNYFQKNVLSQQHCCKKNFIIFNNQILKLMKRQNSVYLKTDRTYQHIKKKEETMRSPSRFVSPNRRSKSRTQDTITDIIKSITKKPTLISYDSNCQSNAETNCSIKSPEISKNKKIINQNHDPNKNYYQMGRFNNNSIVKNPASTSKRNASASLKQITISQFSFLQELGSGKFGKVYLCQNKQTNKQFAMKCISKKQLVDSKMQHQIEREISIQKELNHPNILKLYEVFEDSQQWYLLLEYAQGGSLFQSLIKQQRYAEPKASRIVKQTALAIKYMHEKNVIHRDIKPENILWGENDEIKLSDFGWSIKSNQPRDTLCGTLDYLSPEMLEGKGYDFSIDIWSLGVLTFELCCGKTPFVISEKGFEGKEFPCHLSKDAKDLINSLLVERHKRPTINDVLGNIWLE